MALIKFTKWFKFVKTKILKIHIITAFLSISTITLTIPSLAFADTSFNINGKTWQFSDKEISLVKYFLTDDIETYLKGGEAQLQPYYKGEKILSINVKEIDKIYHKNEVAADLKYKDKYLFVTGTVDSINKGLGNNYYLKFRGNENRYMQPRASMENGHQNYLANLNKGDKISLLCKDGGMIIGSITFRHCIPESEAITEISTEYIKNIQKNIHAGDKDSISLLSLADAYASLLPATSTCYMFTGMKTKDCQQEMSKVSEKELKKALDELGKKYGVSKN